MRAKGIKEQSAQAFEELQIQMSPVYSQRAGGELAKQYMLGLLSPIERKNGWLKRMALNIVRTDEGFEKASGPRKRFQASWDGRCLETVLRAL